MTGIDRAEIKDRMGYHPATKDAAVKYDHLRSAAIAFALSAVELTPPGREQSLMVTHIEDALMWGSKAIARTTPADLTDTAKVARVLPSDDEVSLGQHPDERVNVEPAVAEPTAAGLPVQPQVGYPGQTRSCQCGDVQLSVSEPDYIEGGKRHVVAPGTCVTL